MKNRIHFSQKSLEEQLYIIGLIALPIAVALGIVFFVFLSPKIQTGCIFRAFTGLYCPGCGGTRAVEELFHGHFLKALWYHPFVVYCTGLYAAYMLSHTIAKFYPGIHGIRFHAWYLYAALALLLINCVTKNYLLFCYGIEL